MSLKVVDEGWKQRVYEVKLIYTPDPTCFNAEGVEHFGTDCMDCGCASCNRIRGHQPAGRISFNSRTDGKTDERL